MRATGQLEGSSGGGALDVGQVLDADPDLRGSGELTVPAPVPRRGRHRSSAASDRPPDEGAAPAGPQSVPRVVELAPGVLALAGNAAATSAGWHPPRRRTHKEPPDSVAPGGGPEGDTWPDELKSAGGAWEDPDPDAEPTAHPPPDPRAGIGWRPHRLRIGQVGLFAIVGLTCGLAVAAVAGAQPRAPGAPALLGYAGADSGPGSPAAVPDPGASVTLPKSAPAGNDVPTSAPDWTDVLGELDRIRSRALIEANRKTLAKAVATGSPAWAADTSLMEQLEARGVRPRSLRTELIAVTPGPGAADGSTTALEVDRAGRVVLLVSDRRAAYDLLDRSGAVVGRVEASAKRRWRVVLVAAANKPGWLIQEVAVSP